MAKAKKTYTTSICVRIGGFWTTETLQFQAHTKSEARAECKPYLSLRKRDRLPAGMRFTLVRPEGGAA